MLNKIISNKNINKLEELLVKLKSILEENGFDDTIEDVFENIIINNLENIINEYNN